MCTNAYVYFRLFQLSQESFLLHLVILRFAQSSLDHGASLHVKTDPVLSLHPIALPESLSVLIRQAAHTTQLSLTDSTKHCSQVCFVSNRKGFLGKNGMILTLKEETSMLFTHCFTLPRFSSSFTIWSYKKCTKSSSHSYVQVGGMNLKDLKG